MKEQMINLIQKSQSFGFQRRNGDMIKFTPQGKRWRITSFIDASGQIEIAINLAATKKQAIKFVEESL
jgi:hypothetical protein